MKKHQVLIAGGGASGSITALILKEAGIDAAVMEAQDRILKKILVTGNGRCNITNEKLKAADDVSAWFSSTDESFHFEPVLEHGADKTQALFNRLGLPLTTLEGGKMYPLSLQASSVSDLIRLRLKELGVPVYLNSRVKSIAWQDGEFTLLTQVDAYQGSRVIIAAGGQAMPASGSDGSFYRICRELGHTVVKPLPALVQLKTNFPQLRALSGVKAESRLTLYDRGSRITAEDGELLFADYGLSGPPVLQLSRFASKILSDGREPLVTINLFPNIKTEEVQRLILEQTALFPDREAQDLLNGIVNKKLIPVLFKQSGLDKMTRPIREIPYEVLDRVITMLTAWPMKVIETLGFSASQSTLGGVDLKEVNHRTLESKKLPHLYFSGEILDVCGACGGYNLQWAWSSAFATAEAIISSLQGMK